MEQEVAAGAEDTLMKITPLGAGGEVGRSCVVIEFKGKKIMLDCGIHPAYKGMDALPFFDTIEPREIDFVLVSHFHLDHIASLPFFTEKTEFKGRVFMTHATKAVGLLLIKDYVRVSHLSVDDMLFDDQDLQRCFDRVEAIDFHQEIEVEGVKFSCHHAGHVLGGAMFNIEIAGVRILYTGDYSREEDRHLPLAELPPFSPHVMICESTYGIKSHEPLKERETRFTRLVRDIVMRGGRCLIPVFASGRAQELLLILDEYWEAHPELHNVPVYYASALANKCMGVYQTYINMMNQRIRKQFPKVNPFKFGHIVNIKNTDQFDDAGPCVMMASPGMLQSGMSRELFEAWCPDPKNGIIIPGYCVEGTLAKTILNNPKDITTMDGKKLPLRMSVDYISFSAHVDYTQNSTYIKEVDPSSLVLVHGDAYEMDKLRKALEAEYRESEKNIRIFTPSNGMAVSLAFKGERVAKVVGKLAANKPKHGQVLSGIAMTKDFDTTIMTPDDLGKTGYELTTSVVTQRVVVPHVSSLSLLQYHLTQMFQKVETFEPRSEAGTEEGQPKTNLKGVKVKTEADGQPSSSSEEPALGLRVFDCVNIVPFDEGSVVMEWIGNALNDMIADTILSIVLSIDKNPSSVKALQNLQEEEPAYAKLQAKHQELLSKHFGEVRLSGNCFLMSVNGVSATLDLESMEVSCENGDLAKRITAVSDRIMTSLQPVK